MPRYSSSFIFSSIITVVAIVVSIIIPEIRCSIGLSECVSKERNMDQSEIDEVPNDDFLLGDGGIKKFGKYNVSLAASFRKIYGEDIASLTISPKGDESYIRPVLAGYTEEISVKNEKYFIHILFVDFNSREIFLRITK